MKVKIKKILREHYGSYESVLECQYVDKITKILMESDDEIKGEWATYNQLMLEFKFGTKNGTKVKELLYRLTEDTNPSKECIELLKECDELSPEMRRLYNKIRNF